MRFVARSITFTAPISATLTLTEIAVALARGALRDHPNEREITLLGVSVSNLVLESMLQLELSVDDDRWTAGLGAWGPTLGARPRGRPGACPLREGRRGVQGRALRGSGCRARGAPRAR